MHAAPQQVPVDDSGRSRQRRSGLKCVPHSPAAPRSRPSRRWAARWLVAGSSEGRLHGDDRRGCASGPTQHIAGHVVRTNVRCQGSNKLT